MAFKGTAPVAALALLAGCGSAATDEPGRCKQVATSNYTAGGTDTDGKKWTFELGSPDVNVRCNSATESGTITITGIVRDSLGSAKAGVVVRPVLSGAGDKAALSINTKKSDLNTDACGVASFTINWSCPAANKEVGGAFYAFSGPLFSEKVQITVSNLVIASATSASGGATPAPGGTAPAPAAPVAPAP